MILLLEITWRPKTFVWLPNSKASRASQRSRWTAHFMRRRWQPRPSLLKGNQGGKATKWLPAHFNFEGKNASKLKRVRPSTLRDLPPCPPIQQNNGRRSRPGANPFISALTVARCSAILPGVWPQLRDILSISRSVGRGTGLSYTCRRSLKTGRFFAHSHSQKFSLFSCRSKRGARSTAPRFPRQPRQQV